MGDHFEWQLSHLRRPKTFTCGSGISRNRRKVAIRPITGLRPERTLQRGSRVSFAPTAACSATNTFRRLLDRSPTLNGMTCSVRCRRWNRILVDELERLSLLVVANLSFAIRFGAFIIRQIS